MLSSVQTALSLNNAVSFRKHRSFQISAAAYISSRQGSSFHCAVDPSLCLGVESNRALVNYSLTGRVIGSKFYCQKNSPISGAAAYPPIINHSPMPIIHPSFRLAAIGRSGDHPVHIKQLDRDDLIVFRAARCMHLGRFTDALADQPSGNWRGGRNQPA